MSIYKGTTLISGVGATPTQGTWCVGQIVHSLLPIVSTSVHLLNGALIQHGSYGAFVDYIANLYAATPNASYFTTETDWQTQVQTYGVCGKFVYDSINNTVRLPKITGILEGTTDVNALGELVEQFVRLPNIVGRFQGVCSNQWTQGAFFEENYWGDLCDFSDGGGSGHMTNIWIDASRSSSVYSGDDTNTRIQPQTIKAFYYIVLATSTKTQIQQDLDEVVTDLNGKAGVDLVNVNNTGTSLAAGWAMPSDTYEDLTIGADGTEYTAPANGWVYMQGSATANSSGATVANLTANISLNHQCFSNGWGYTSQLLPVNKGDIFKTNWLNFNVNFVRFIYAKGSESEA